MKHKKRTNIKAQVNKLVKLSLADTTSPTPGDLRKGRGTDAAWGVVDRHFTYEQNKPAILAEIGRRVRAKVRKLREMAALAGLMVLRGERLQQLNKKRRARVAALIAGLKAIIKTLPRSTRKGRLTSFLAYNCGVYFAALERFFEAAYWQSRSAEIAKANGDKPGEAIGLFLERVYLLMQAMVNGDQTEMDAAYIALEQRFKPLVDAVRGTPLKESWGKKNAPCHLFQARYIWLGEDHPDLDKWVTSVVSDAGSLGGVWVDIAKHYSTINSFRNGDTRRAELMKIAVESGDATRKAEALLVLARRAIADGDKKLARGLVSKMPKKGARHIVAIAKRLLA